MTSSRRVRPLAIAAVAALTLTGCGAGLDAQTSQVRTFSEGANRVVDEQGTMLIRNLYIAPPPSDTGVYEEGDDARAYVVLVNQSDQDDRLVSAESPQFDSVTLFAGGDPEEGVAEHTENFLEFLPDREERPEAPDDAEDAEDADGISEAAEGGEGGEGEELDGVDLPYNSKTSILPGTGYLLLEGLSERLFPGQVAQMTLQFERAGSVTLDVYVHVLGEPFPREAVVDTSQVGE